MHVGRATVVNGTTYEHEREVHAQRPGKARGHVVTCFHGKGNVAMLGRARGASPPCAAPEHLGGDLGMDGGKKMRSASDAMHFRVADARCLGVLAVWPSGFAHGASAPVVGGYTIRACAHSTYPVSSLGPIAVVSVTIYASLR